MAAICRKLAVMALSTFLLVVVAEFVARLGEPGPLRLFDVSPYQKSAELQHVHIPRMRVAWDGSFYGINSRGWRGPEFEPTYQPEELRVVAIGDSCTFGKGVEEADSWPRQLERMLQAKLGPARTVRVANLGVNGYSGADYLEVFLRQALPVRPQLVVLAYNVNDFPNVVKAVDAAVFLAKGNLRSRLPYDVRASLGRLACFRWLRATYYEWNRARDLERSERVARSIGESEATSPEALQSERDRLRRIVDECDAIGAHVAMFLFPYESEVYLEDYSRAPLDSARELAQPLGIAYGEFVESFRTAARASDPPTRLFLRGDRYHPNPRGYSIVAAGVVELLGAQGWLSAP